MSTETLARTIYVGNIQSIPDAQLREYFEKFATVESISRQCSSSSDEWLIDYRFIQFSPGTDLSRFVSNQIDHSICHIRLDIHTYDAACRDETRLVSDRKICIAHTDPKLNRNEVKKAFQRYGRILNCNCVSSGHGIEYVYIEFESINSVLAVFQSKTSHFARKTSLAVRRTLRPTKIVVKNEPNQIETAEYSSNNGKPLTRLNRSERRSTFDENRLKSLEKEFDLRLRENFDEINSKIDEFLENQTTSYKNIRKYFVKQIRRSSSSSSSTDEEKSVRSPRKTRR